MLTSKLCVVSLHKCPVLVPTALGPTHICLSICLLRSYLPKVLYCPSVVTWLPGPQLSARGPSCLLALALCDVNTTAVCCLYVSLNKCLVLSDGVPTALLHMHVPAVGTFMYLSALSVTSCWLGCFP